MNPWRACGAHSTTWSSTWRIHVAPFYCCITFFPYHTCVVGKSHKTKYAGHTYIYICVTLTPYVKGPPYKALLVGTCMSARQLTRESLKVARKRWHRLLKTRQITVHIQYKALALGLYTVYVPICCDLSNTYNTYRLSRATILQDNPNSVLMSTRVTTGLTQGFGTCTKISTL